MAIERKTQAIEYGGYKIVVSEATTLQGMRRTMMRIKAADENAKDDEGPNAADDGIKILRSITYPDLMSVVVDSEGFELWPISFDVFLNLPDALVGEWERVAYDLNPHWLPGGEQQEKKQPNGSTES